MPFRTFYLHLNVTCLCACFASSTNNLTNQDDSQFFKLSTHNPIIFNDRYETIPTCTVYSTCIWLRSTNSVLIRVAFEWGDTWDDFIQVLTVILTTSNSKIFRKFSCKDRFYVRFRMLLFSEQIKSDLFRFMLNNFTQYYIYSNILVS